MNIPRSDGLLILEADRHQLAEALANEAALSSDVAEAKVEGEKLVARARQLPDKWAVAVGGGVRPAEVQSVAGQDGHPVGVLTYAVRLQPGAEQAWTIGTVVEIESGAAIALKNLEDWLPLRETLLAEKQSLYADLLAGGPRFHGPDAHFDAAFSPVAPPGSSVRRP